MVVNRISTGTLICLWHALHEEIRGVFGYGIQHINEGLRTWVLNKVYHLMNMLNPLAGGKHR